MIRKSMQFAAVFALVILLSACDIPFIDIDIPLIPGI